MMTGEQRVMVVDTSAIMAILQRESEADAFAKTLEHADMKLVSTVSLLEAGMLALSRKGAQGAQALDALLDAAELQAANFDFEQAALARAAFDRYGKGRHPAGLNFGDCAVYALAATQGLPLLFKGKDFSQTDLRPVLPA